MNVLFQVNKGITLVDLLSFSTDLEAQADQLVSLTITVPTSSNDNNLTAILCSEVKIIGR